LIVKVDANRIFRFFERVPSLCTNNKFKTNNHGNIYL